VAVSGDWCPMEWSEIAHTHSSAQQRKAKHGALLGCLGAFLVAAGGGGVGDGVGSGVVPMARWKTSWAKLRSRQNAPMRSRKTRHAREWADQEGALSESLRVLLAEFKWNKLMAL